jgi:holo-[acyl-carrier protein] synthase
VHSLGLGVDIVRVERLRGAATTKPRILERVFSHAELVEAGDGPERWRRLAARFAAKEAVVKACGGLHGSRWRDISVHRVPGAGPRVALAGALAAWVAQQRGQLQVSLSHERDFAVAVAILTTEGDGCRP